LDRAVERLAAGSAMELQELDKLRPIALVYFARRALILQRDGAGLANDFSDHPAGFHHAHRA
jgi:hypothetical protein